MLRGVAQTFERNKPAGDPATPMRIAPDTARIAPDLASPYTRQVPAPLSICPVVPFFSACLRRSARNLQRPLSCLLLASSLLLSGCHHSHFPHYAEDYREFAYVSDGASGTVTVLNLIDPRRERTLAVGRQPTGLAVNPRRNEIYVANTGSDSVSVIDAETNRVVSTIGVHHKPFFLSVAPDGLRAYVANAGSDTVSVLDLVGRREIATAPTGEGPGLARIAPDNRTLVVSNRVGGSLSVYAVNSAGVTGARDTTAGANDHPLQLRATFPNCPGATDIAILPDSTKAFVACSDSHQIMAVWLGVPANTWRGKQDPSLQADHLLAFLDVGKTPTHLTLKPDGGEVFSTNFGSNSLSELSTWTNEVEGTYPGVMQPSRAIISRDNSTLWVSDFGADSATLYSIDDGHIEASVRTGSHPDALAFSADEHLLLVANAGSGDVALLRTDGTGGPTLFTVLPTGSQPNDIVVKGFHTRGDGKAGR